MSNYLSEIIYQNSQISNISSSKSNYKVIDVKYSYSGTVGQYTIKYTNNPKETFTGTTLQSEQGIIFCVKNGKLQKNYSRDELILIHKKEDETPVVDLYVNHIANITSKNDAARALIRTVRQMSETTYYNIYKQKEVILYGLFLLKDSNNQQYVYILSSDDISYPHRAKRIIRGEGIDRTTFTVTEIKYNREGLFLGSGYYKNYNGNIKAAIGGQQYVCTIEGETLQYQIILGSPYLPDGYTYLYQMDTASGSSDAPCNLIKINQPNEDNSSSSSPSSSSNPGKEISNEIAERTITLDYTKGAMNLSSNYISNFANWKINFIGFNNNERVLGNSVDKNNLTILNKNILGEKNENLLYPSIKDKSIDCDLVVLCSALDQLIKKSKSRSEESDSRIFPSIILEIYDKDTGNRYSENDDELTKYFTAKDKPLVNFVYKEWNGEAYVENSSINFTTFIEATKKPLRNLNNINFDVKLLLSQEKEVLNLYSLELFEAYTRGHDFIQENYTTVRPQERNPEDSSETSRIMNFDDNYFTYKYTGRNIDITKQNTNKKYLTSGWNSERYTQPIYVALAHECDILLETDVTLGETYGEQLYFVEAIKAPKYEDNSTATFTGEYLYKDSFKVEDYLDTSNGGYDDTIYTDDDISIITAKIDLLQCKYYHPEQSSSQNQWCDCSYGDNSNICKKECMYQKLGYCPYRFSTEKHPRRIRTLQQSKSNRFNLIQEIGKVFQIYPYFYIEHEDNGKVLLDENGKMIKRIFYMTEKGKEQKIGFRYEKNLSSSSRTLDSGTITTKLYVENIDSSYAKNGLNSIQTAPDNIGKTSYILDFSYYTNNGSMDAEMVQRDLYGIKKEDFSFLPRIGALNTLYDKYSNLIITLTGETLTELQAQNEVSITGITTTLEERKKIAQTMYQFKSVKINRNNVTTSSYTTSDTYKNYVIKYREQASILWGLIEQLFYSQDYFSMPIITKKIDQKENLYSFDVIKYGEAIEKDALYKNVYNNFYNKYCKGELFWRLVIEGFPDVPEYVPPFNSWVDFKEKIVDQFLYEINGNLGKYRSLYNEVKYWKTERAKILNKINDLSKQFYQKYEPFIKEGTFSDSNYLTDNEYYWAGVQVLKDSCKPKITYSFSVIDLSALDEDYVFELADTTFVEDIDFFGINPITGLPNRQKVLINEITYDLDQPSNNSIGIINYTSDFSDLFESITASVQSLTFNENVYKRASNFTAQQYITTESLQDTLDIGDLTLLDTVKDNIIIDENGTEGNDINNAASQYRITGQGIEFSTDAGETWDVGLGPKGINMDYAKFGSLDTSKIQIMNGNYIYFLWDKDGINSYRNPATSTSGLVDFTRFNRYGLSLVENNNIRLRAGYEYKSNNDGYNQTGDYTKELPLTDQNIGFYLYNNQGQAIFKTETESEYKEDASANYTARLSLTGEMFVTNKVLDSNIETFDTETTQSIYQMSNKWNFSEKNVEELIDAQRFTIKSNKMKEIIDSYQTSSPHIGIISNNKGLSHGSTPETDQLRTFSYIFNPAGDNYYSIKEEINDEDPDNINYIYNFPELYVYELLSGLNNLTEITGQVEFRIWHIISAYFTSTNQLQLNNQNFDVSDLISWLQGDFLANSLPQIISNYDENSIDDSNAEITYLDENDTYVLSEGEVDDKIYDTNDIGKIIISSISYIFDSIDTEETYRTTQNPSLQEFEYYDSNTNNYKIKSFYPITINGQVTYWENKEATDDMAINSEENFSSSEVGIFINNKRSLDIGSLFEDRTNISDQTISKDAPAEQNMQAQEAILSGAERTFMISTINHSKSEVKYNNILSVLKNGVLYLGGTVTDFYGKKLDISGLQYMPDEVRINNPSIVMSRNGQIWCDWSSFFLAYNDNGTYQYTTFSLMDFVNAIQNWSGSSSSSNSSGTDTAAVAGYYIEDPT